MVASWAAAAACELVFEVWTWGRATEVFAEPNGTFTAQLHPGPVRVRRGWWLGASRHHSGEAGGRDPGAGGGGGAVGVLWW